MDILNILKCKEEVDLLDKYFKGRKLNEAECIIIMKWLEADWIVRKSKE